MYSNHAQVNHHYSLGALGGGGGAGSSGGGAGALSGGVGGGSSSSRSINLMLKFDENDVLIDYTVSQVQY